MVISAAALCHWRPPKLAAPDDQGLFQHAALLQILDQRSGALIDKLRGGSDTILDTAMVIPTTMIELNEAHATFRQSPGLQAITAERAITGSATIGIDDMLWLIGHVGQFGNGTLHPKGHFIRRQSRRNLWILQGTVTQRVDF